MVATSFDVHLLLIRRRTVAAAAAVRHNDGAATKETKYDVCMYVASYLLEHLWQ